MTTKRPFSWKVRKFIWDSISIIKFRGNKPEEIPLPSANPQPLKMMSLAKRIPSIPINNILLADHVPADEASTAKLIVFKIQTWLYSAFPPMQDSLPQIDSDTDAALTEAYTARHQKHYPTPKLPDEYRGDGMPELGILAVASPYACYLERSAEGHYQWDFRDLEGHELHHGLRPLGSRVIFELDPESRRFQATQIETTLGTHTPDDEEWYEAKAIALCAASTHLTLVRHFNWVHLACGSPFAIATRNQLPHNHPLCRLVWPHMFGTQNSNYLVTMGQMWKGGDFETIFSFTHAGMCNLFADTYDRYRATVIDPELDWEARGLLTDEFDAPVQNNLSRLFAVMHAHAGRYVETYYDSDESIRDDRAVQNWIVELNQLIPNGVDGSLQGQVTRKSVARLIAGFIYMATVQHEALGTCMWNYQAWVGKHPIRVQENGERVPLDVYQRLVNANFNLNVDRAKLMQDFSYLALDPKGADLFKTFKRELEALETELAGEEFTYWRITPKMLEANINA